MLIAMSSRPTSSSFEQSTFSTEQKIRRDRPLSSRNHPEGFIRLGKWKNRCGGDSNPRYGFTRTTV